MLIEHLYFVIADKAHDNSDEMLTYCNLPIFFMSRVTFDKTEPQVVYAITSVTTPAIYPWLSFCAKSLIFCHKFIILYRIICEGKIILMPISLVICL